MGFFDKLKHAFDTGGIDLDISVPDRFRWSDDVLPVTVTITGHDEEPRTVAELELWLREDDDDSRNSRGRHRDGVRMTHGGPIELAPGESVTLEIAFPLSASGAVEGLSGGEAPGWLKAAGGVIGTLTELGRETPWYRFSVSTTVEGAGAHKTATRRIRNNAAGEFGDGRIVDLDFL
jgi:hypothetical protein